MVATLLDGAVLVAALARPRLWSKAWKLLSLSSGAVVVVGTDVADTGIMDGVVTVAEVLRSSLKLLSPSNVAGVGTVAAEATLMGSVVLVVLRRWLLRKRRKRKKLSHEFLCNSNCVCMHECMVY